MTPLGYQSDCVRPGATAQPGDSQLPPTFFRKSPGEEQTDPRRYGLGLFVVALFILLSTILKQM